jgi:Coenzyme PQQ synthesis protein D (PqqD)
MSETTPLVRKNEIVIQELDNELLIYDLKANKALSLNETAALVWQLSNGDKTISEIAETATKKLNDSVIEELVWLALGQLKKENLLENGEEITNHFQGSSRREVIRKVGLSSLVVLPFISSFVAPTAIHAQSGNCSVTPFPLGCSCVVGGAANSGNCASNCCDFPPGGNSGNCVPRATLGLGGACIMSCQCASICCVTNSCVPSGLPINSPCVSPCQCASLSCQGVICA